MTDYAQLKVPELKKILTDRLLPISGNKADLIARLQEDDKKSATAAGAPSAPTGDDEIDWDEDDAKATTTSVPNAITAGSQGQGKASNHTPDPKKPDIEPAKIKEPKSISIKNVSKAADAPASTGATTSAVAPTPAIEEEPRKDFTIGIQKTDAEKEVERRAARAKRFGIAEDNEENKKLERAKKFGADKVLVVKGLDDALPERRAKRGREAADKQGGRNAKRQTPDRRAEAPAKGAAGAAKKQVNQPVKQPAKQLPKQSAKRITDDPAEKAKAEARAKRFQTAA